MTRRTELATTQSTTPQPTPPPLAYDEYTAARMLGVCPKTLFNLRKEGKLGCAKIGTRTVYTQQHLQAFLDSCSQATK